MRLLQLFEPRDGGVPDHVRRLGTGLAERGHSVTAVGPPDATCRADLESAGVEYVALPWSATVPDLEPDRACVRGLRAVLDERAPFDVVHTHGQKAGLLARPLARRRGLRVLYTPHCFVHRSQAARERIDGKIRTDIGRHVERVLGRGTAMIVAVSQDEADVAVRDRIVPRGRVTVVEHGLQPDVSAEPHPGLAAFKAGDEPLFGFLAGLRPQKGLPDLLDALELLAAANRAPKVAIVGNGPEAETVERRLADGPLGATTRLFPFEGGRVEPYLAAFDVYMLPSLWEGMPIGVVEALMMGVPVIASSVGGTPEAVAHERTGLLVPPRDPAALAAAIRRMQDAGARARMSAAAAPATRDRFALARMIDELEAIYARVAGAGSG